MKFAIFLEVLSYIAWIVISILVTALLTSWALSEVWLWFISAQYGAGPSAGAWFGIAVIARLILSSDLKIPKGDERDDEYELREVIKRDLFTWGGILFALLVVWLMGSAVGWVR